MRSMNSPDPDPTSWVTDAIRDALDRGMVPFVAVVPVSPDVLRDSLLYRLDQKIAHDAAEAVAKAVRDWQQRDGTEGD